MALKHGFVFVMTPTSYVLICALVTIIVYLFIKIQKEKRALDSKEYRHFKLIQKVSVTHNTALYRFALNYPEQVLGLPTGQHISVAANINGKWISRSYTPVSSKDQTGYFELVVKSYPTGNISKLFGELRIGDYISVCGPKGNFTYTANKWRALGMIAGGTGITPMFQIIRAVCENPADKTSIRLIFANVYERDILLRDDLDKLVEKYPKKLHVYYVLNHPPSKDANGTQWMGGTGFVTSNMIREHCPPPAPDIKILLCGPHPMVKALTMATAELGYDRARAISRPEDQVYKF